MIKGSDILFCIHVESCFGARNETQLLSRSLTNDRFCAVVTL